MKNPEITQSSRVEQAAQLVEDFNLQQDAEFFSDSVNRLEFFASLDFDDFLSITQHVNARVRGLVPRERATTTEIGGQLPLLATPPSAEKPEVLRAGFEAIKSYINQSQDDVEQKIRGIGMAVEALVIWVHQFNDGNGRTSRFLAKFIEDGTTDVDQLVRETASNKTRQRIYGEELRVDQGNMIKGMDLIMSEDQIEEYKKTEMPLAEGVSRSITRLLSSRSAQEYVEAKTDKYKAQIAEYERRSESAA